MIAEVGAWKNILDPDPQKRSDNLKYVIDRMHLANEVGARCCVDIAGSFNPKLWYGPDPKNLSTEFFDATVGIAVGSSMRSSPPTQNSLSR